jgi:hypothetical protein
MIFHRGNLSRRAKKFLYLTRVRACRMGNLDAKSIEPHVYRDRFLLENSRAQAFALFIGISGKTYVGASRKSEPDTVPTKLRNWRRRSSIGSICSDIEEEFIDLFYVGGGGLLSLRGKPPISRWRFAIIVCAGSLVPRFAFARIRMALGKLALEKNRNFALSEAVDVNPM